MRYERLRELDALGSPAAVLPILSEAARYMRRLTVDMIYEANRDAPRRGHYGSSTSSIELCLAEVVRLANPWRDFVSWKPHASPPIYALLHLLGELSADDLRTLRRHGSPCQAYFNHWLTPLVDMSTGCMGFSLPFCCGRAMGDKIEGRDRRVFVNLGDAEFTMPMSVESLRFGKINRLNNFGLVVDDNRQSMSGPTVHSMGDRPIEDYFRFFGWNVVVADGHNLPALWEAFGDVEREMQVSESPSALVAKTDKWYGLPALAEGGWAHMQRLDEEAYQRFRADNGFADLAPFAPAPREVREFFAELAWMLKSNARRAEHTKHVVPPFPDIELNGGAHAASTLGAVGESFRKLASTAAGRAQVLYVDPDLGQFPGLLPNPTGPHSVEGETYSHKNPEGYVVRAGLADPFAVALTAGLGKAGARYPVMPLLDGFGLLVSESVKQGSLEGAHFLVLGIETNPWEGLTHQPGTSANTVFRNLPDRPAADWDGDWEPGVYDYYPCHPREARLLFEDCLRHRRLGYMKLTNNEAPAHLLAEFRDVRDEDFVAGGYVVGPRYEQPGLVVLTGGRETWNAIEAVQALRERYPEQRIQLAVVTRRNLPVSERAEDVALMARLVPEGAAVLRVSGQPADTLGVSHGQREATLSTRRLTQSCGYDELAADQGFDPAGIVAAAERLLAVVASEIER